MSGNNNRRDGSQSGNQSNDESTQSAESIKKSADGGYGRPLGPGGGFGQGGYGSYGTQGGAEQPGSGGYSDGTWGNEHNGRHEPPTSPGRGSNSSEEMATSQMDEEGGGSRPSEETNAGQRRSQTRARVPGEQGRQAGPETQGDRWQRQAITAGEIMTTDVKTVTADTLVQEIAAVMMAANCGIVPVVDGSDKLIGVCTDRDIVVRACAAGLSPIQARARDVMTADVEAVTADEEIKDVIALMGRKQVRRIPVVDKDDRLVGIISMADVANRADHDEDLAEALERVSAKQRRRE